MSPVWIAILVVAGIFLLVVFTTIGSVFSLWLQALSASADIGIGNLIGMKLRRVDARTIVTAKISLIQAGLQVTTRQLEAHYMAQGRVPNVARAMIAAHRAAIDMPWEQAAAIDLAGRDVLDAVQTSVNPRVIDVPNANSGRQTHDGVAKDGIQLKVKARVTVRTNMKQLISGAGEETVVARVGEGIVAAIGSADTYKHVLEQPDMISKTVLAKGLDAGTAFQILSIDIADMDVGDNIGAKLQIAQADAAKQLAQAEAEKRRALAVAQEQENKALAQLNRAKVIEAEAQIPLAMSEAFRSGHLGVMDYFRMKNIQADTSMRESIGGGGAAGVTGEAGDNR
ncbi:MAG TPA: flotillin-like protein FloA [Phycisphaerae bacterium]|nr:flotillin-like protein FloA [Phycisphaerae bacterium]